MKILAQVLLLACACLPTGAQALSTRSFTSTDVGSDPGTVRRDGDKIVVDLSSIRGATVFRATLDPYVVPRQSRHGFDLRESNGARLRLLAPRYLAFDVTSAVRGALPTGTLTLTIAAGSRPVGRTLSLDVLCDRPAPRPIPQVAAARARSQDGDTMITFAEVDPPHRAPTWTLGGYGRARAALEHDHSPKHRYRIYRSRQPFTEASVIAAAELIDEISPLSGWHAALHGFDPTSGEKNDLVIPTLPIADHTLAAPGTGIYVRAHRGDAAEDAWYLVSHTLDGAEDFTQLLENDNATRRVSETPGSGMTLLWREQRATGTWSHGRRADAELRYYVRWSSPPDWNLPSQPHDYRLGVPDAAVAAPPLEIRPPPWSASFDDPRGWTLYGEGALLLTFNLLRYNSYTAFHECAGTLRAYDEGTVQPYVQARVLDFVFGFVAPTYHVDTERIHLRGDSMGGAAAHLWGMRSGHVFASLVASVGNNIPAEDLTQEFSSIGEWGPIGWRSLYANPQLARFGYPRIRAEDGIVVWDYFDNVQWLTTHRSVDTPHITYSNSPNDAFIDWRPAWKVTRAMMATRRPFNFSWGPRGHFEGAQDAGVSLRLHESMPAFSNTSTDDDLGATPSASPPLGQINRYLRWVTGSVADTPECWEAEILLAPFAPGTGCTADVTPRRLQRLPHAPGQAYVWSLLRPQPPAGHPNGARHSPGEGDPAWVEARGAVVADADGLLTIPGLRFIKQPRRLRVERAERAALSASQHCLSGNERESTEVRIDAGVGNAGRAYVVHATLTKTAATAGAAEAVVPAPPLGVFTGVLDAAGRATFRFVSPERFDAATVDASVDLALSVVGHCSWEPNPLRIEIGAVHDPSPAATGPAPSTPFLRAGLLGIGLCLIAWTLLRRSRRRAVVASGASPRRPASLTPTPR